MMNLQNYQARALTSSTHQPHTVEIDDKGNRIYEPSIEATLGSYFDEDWVGITNFFHESRCLLLGRLVQEDPTGYFNTKCRCNDDGNAPPANEKRTVHMTRGNKKVHSELYDTRNPSLLLCCRRWLLVVGC